MKYSKFLILMIFFSFLISCDSSVSFISEIPLNNIKEHSNNLRNLKETNLDDAEASYFKILNDSINNEQPYVYFYLSYFFENDSILSSGLKKFPEDPFLKFSEAIRINDLEILTKKLKFILNEYPHHSLSMSNLLVYSESLYDSATEEIKKDEIVVGLESYISDFKSNDKIVNDYYDFNDPKIGLNEKESKFLIDNLDFFNSKISDSKIRLEKNKKRLAEERRKNKLNQIERKFVDNKYVNYPFGSRTPNNVLNIYSGGSASIYMFDGSSSMGKWSWNNKDTKTWFKIRWDVGGPWTGRFLKDRIYIKSGPIRSFVGNSYFDKY
tara:strand:- start:111 stop:1082 length:972 start_codon:yes stop_codon:yes gene_type:complete